MGIALHELGNISERRVAQLILGLRGLPEFLVAKPGLNSGFMIPQYAAAAEQDVHIPCLMRLYRKLQRTGRLSFNGCQCRNKTA